MSYGAKFVSPVSFVDDVPIIQFNGLSKVYLVPGPYGLFLTNETTQ